MCMVWCVFGFPIGESTLWYWVMFAVKSSKFKRTHGERHRLYQILDKSETVRTFVNNRSKHINNEVFCTSKDSFVPIQNVLEFWSWVLEMYLNVLEFCPDKTLRTLLVTLYCEVIGQYTSLEHYNYHLLPNNVQPKCMCPRVLNHFSTTGLTVLWPLSTAFPATL